MPPLGESPRCATLEPDSRQTQLMTAIDRSHFLAPEGRLGQWWLPRNEDQNEHGNLPHLPIRREAGILASSEAGHWELLVSSTRRPGDETIDEPWANQLIRREVIWGVTNEDNVSLFDGMCLRPRSALTSDSESTWTGNWSAESNRAWVRPEDRARHIEVELDAGAAWSGQGCGLEADIDLRDHWDSETRTFGIPDALVRNADVASARIQLRLECEPLVTADSLSVRLRTYFAIEDDLSYREIGDKWVRPLYELLSFCCARNASVTGVRARDSHSGQWVNLRYPQPLAPVVNSTSADSASGRIQFASLRGLVAKGLDFETLLGAYVDLQSRGFGAVLASLVDSQGALLDQSVGARFLSAIRSLETFEKTRQPSQSSVNLKTTVKRLLNDSGQIGVDIKRLRRIDGSRGFAKSIPKLRNEFAAHGQSGDYGRFPTESENLKLGRHLAALQWLLRWRYVQDFGISAEAAESLVTESAGYRSMLRLLDQHEASSAPTPSATLPYDGPEA